MTSSRPVLWRKLVACFSVPLIASGILWAAPGTAMAVPGDAVAVGFLADIAVEVVNGPNVVIDDRIGEVTAPPDDAASLAGAETLISTDLGPLGVQTNAQAQLIETSVTSGPLASAATAQVTGAEINTAGGPLVIDSVSSEVSCPVGGPATADVTPPGTVTHNGVEVVLDPDGETVITYDLGQGPSTLTLTVNEQTTTSDTAAATAFVFGLEQNFPGVVTASGTLTLAQTSCEAPALPAPTASSLDPGSGPTAGGTEVTVTGTGFVPGRTTVRIGTKTVSASAVEVAANRRSLTFTTPSGPAGPVDVVVTTPGGSTAPLEFRYVPPAPTASSLDPESGPTAGGTEVTVTGTGFVPGRTTVRIGDERVPASAVEVADDGRSLTFSTPAGPAGTLGVIVTTPYGSTEPLEFRFVAGARSKLAATGPTSLSSLAAGAGVGLVPVSYTHLTLPTTPYV